jgi:hypothetical protein
LVDDNTSFDTNKDKGKELDRIKKWDKEIETYNKDPTGHYHLRLVKAVKRAWF